MIFLFNKMVKNIFLSIFLMKQLHMLIKILRVLIIKSYADKDPPCINNKGKQLIVEKNEMFKKYVKAKYLIKLNISKTN